MAMCPINWEYTVCIADYNPEAESKELGLELYRMMHDMKRQFIRTLKEDYVPNKKICEVLEVFNHFAKWDVEFEKDLIKFKLKEAKNE